jgi:predicted metal-dependent hydrolase
MKFTYKIERKNIHSIRIKLISKTSFLVTAPFFTPKFMIDGFIKQNMTWIETNAKKIIKSPKIKNLKSLNIIDQKYDLIFQKTISNSLIIDDKNRKIFINCSNFTETNLKKLFNQKFRLFALKLIKNEINIINKNHNFTINHITVRNQSSRFGSCSNRGNLNFNWQIIFFPYPIFRHIIYHELTHLSIKNHKKEFWEQLSYYDSDYKIHNKYLKLDYKKHLLC